MPDRLPYTLQSTSAREFRDNGERNHLLAWLARVRPDLTRGVRVGIVRMIERGLDTAGGDALNLAITDPAQFERRLSLTKFTDHGYPAYFRQRLQWAARFLHAAGHDADAAYLDRVLSASRPPKADPNGNEVTGFAIVSAGSRRERKRVGRGGSRNGSRASTSGGSHCRKPSYGDLTAPRQPSDLQELENAIVNGIRAFDASIPVDPELIQHLVPICLRRMTPDAKVQLLQGFTNDLADKTANETSGDGSGAVDTVAEDLIAQIVYPRVASRVCGASGQGPNDHRA